MAVVVAAATGPVEPPAEQPALGLAMVQVLPLHWAATAARVVPAL
jgi:hypothetical protein